LGKTNLTHNRSNDYSIMECLLYAKLDMIEGSGTRMEDLDQLWKKKKTFKNSKTLGKTNLTHNRSNDYGIMECLLYANLDIDFILTTAYEGGALFFLLLFFISFCGGVCVAQD
jgi:hypothetical protein